MNQPLVSLIGWHCVDTQHLCLLQPRTIYPLSSHLRRASLSFLKKKKLATHAVEFYKKGVSHPVGFRSIIVASPLTYPLDSTPPPPAGLPSPVNWNQS